MKKRIAMILAATMICLTACGGKTEKTTQTPESETPQTTETATTDEASGETVSDGSPTSESHANGDGSYRYIYGWDSKEVTLYTPENAKSEGAGIYDPAYVPKDNVFDGMSLTFESEDQGWYCQACDWQSHTVTYLEHVAQYYFNGELDFTINGAVDEEAAKGITDYSQTVTDLGFKWMEKPVQLIVSSYVTDSGIEWTQTFVGVEYENTEAPDKGKGLVGLDFFHDDVLTQDQLAYIAGQIFGVDSGISGDPFAEEAVSTLDASAILGTWTDKESNWGTTYSFEADGTGAMSYSVTGENYPFTYSVDGDQVDMIFEDDDRIWYTVETDGANLVLIDNVGERHSFEAVKETVEEPEETETEETEPEEPAEEENPNAAKLIGTWIDEEGGYNEGFTFNEDMTGHYSWDNEDGTHEGYDFNYSFNFDGSVHIEYENGNEIDSNIEFDGDMLTLSGLWGYLEMKKQK